MEGERGEKKGKERTKSEKGCFIPIIISVYVIVLIFPNISLIIQQVLERKIFIQLLKNEKFTGPILSNTWMRGFRINYSFFYTEKRQPSASKWARFLTEMTRDHTALQ